VDVEGCGEGWRGDFERKGFRNRSRLRMSHRVSTDDMVQCRKW
jgi:hypothetical protein